MEPPSSQHDSASFASIPDDCVLLILENLRVTELVSVSACSRKLRLLAENASNVWLSLIEKDFGPTWKYLPGKTQRGQIDNGAYKNKEIYRILFQVAAATIEETRDVPRSTPSVHIAALGDASVGKTTAMYRYLQDKWIPDLPVTIGADFHSKRVQNVRTGQVSRIVFVDTATQERFGRLGHGFFRLLTSGASFVCYDVSDRQSFEKVESWVAQLRELSSPDIPLALVATKIDLDQELHRVSTEEGRKKAAELQIPFFLSSSKTGQSIREIYHYLLCRVLQDRDEKGQLEPTAFETASTHQQQEASQGWLSASLARITAFFKE